MSYTCPQGHDQYKGICKEGVCSCKCIHCMSYKSKQITISSTSGKSCTVCKPDDLPEMHKRLLDQLERLEASYLMLNGHTQALVQENEKLHKELGRETRL